MMLHKRRRTAWCMFLLGISMAACVPNNEPSPGSSTGQVKAVVKSPMSSYAAARAADQTSFGATPALVTELAQKGMGAWLDEQLALPPSLMDPPSWVISYPARNPEADARAARYPIEAFYDLSLVAPDQLRLRVTWALMQFIVVGPVGPKVSAPAYFNLLQKNAFGNYGTLLREISTSPSMGVYLGNDSNRPRSDECIGCSPNENYARELLQLFSIGVVQLNPDGSVVRDAQGRPKESYTQRDVSELARALTGWRNAPMAMPLPDTIYFNAFQPMVPETWVGAHDRGAKRVLGTGFPAGQSAPQDLDMAIGMLMAHPNIAPFVSLRLIQHLVTSNPTPQYLGRVAAVFRNNGQGVAGDMKAVIRAILLDPEARLGDTPGADRPGFGLIREPVLFHLAAFRGLGCKTAPRTPDGYLFIREGQIPFSPDSVFSFYLPTDRAPGSNLLAPEQQLLSTNELASRLRILEWPLLDTPVNAGTGCDLATFAAAYARSPAAFVELVGERWFRGAMPPTLRNNLLELATANTYDTPIRAATKLLEFALLTPYFGVIQ